MLKIVQEILLAVYGYLRADWYILLIGILLSAGIKVYVDTNKMRDWFERKSRLSILGAVAFGALTPLCACGTTAVMLSMFVSAMPWGTVMAFMISSPLSSPSEFMFDTAFFGLKFATGMLVFSLLMGVLAGVMAHLLEKRTSFFKDQFRLNKASEESTCGCGDSDAKAKVARKSLRKTALSSSRAVSFKYDVMTEKQGFMEKYKVRQFAKEFYEIGIKKILLYFVIFIAVGKIVEMAIPKEWIMGLFSGKKFYSIPLAATVGLPLYLNSSSALPLLKSFINSGAGEGAVIAFLIAGKATGIPVMAGLSTIFKKRAMAFYIGFIYVGAIVSGYVYQYAFNVKALGWLAAIGIIAIAAACLKTGNGRRNRAEAMNEFCRMECKDYEKKLVV